MIRTSVIGLVGMGLLGACAAPPQTPAPAPLRVTNGDASFSGSDGAAARKVAESTCQDRDQRLQSSIYDRYEAGAWVFVEGCA